MKNNKFEHFILTHFNVKFKWSKGNKSTNCKAPDKAWFNHRIKLFNTYCYPSILNQSSKNFRWLIFFDEETTDKNLIKKYKRVTPIFVKDYDFWTFAHISSQLKSLVKDDTEWLVTTRFDCDDAFYYDYVKIVQDNFKPEDMILNPVNGIVYDIISKNAYKYLYRCPNPYITTTEKVSGNQFKTCFRGSHPRMKSYFKRFVQLRTQDPMWLQTIHDKNLGNFLRGDAPLKVTSEILKKFNIKEL